MYSTRPYTNLVPGQTWIENCSLSRRVFTGSFFLIVLTWLAFVLIISGDIHPNPGPIPDHNTSFSNDSLSLSTSSSLSNIVNIQSLYHLSLVHYNVQSIKLKIDQLYSELNGFDILAFTETWLNDSITNDELNMSSFQKPERKDRSDETHGGVIVYVKDTISYVRRFDLELKSLECIWIQLKLSNKSVLLGVFIDSLVFTLSITVKLKIQ